MRIETVGKRLLAISLLLVAGGAHAGGTKGVDCLDLEALSAKAIASAKAKEPRHRAITDFAILQGKENVSESWLAHFGPDMIETYSGKAVSGLTGTSSFLFLDTSFTQTNCDAVTLKADPKDRKSTDHTYNITRYTKTEIEMEPDWKKLIERAIDELENDVVGNKDGQLKDAITDARKKVDGWVKDRTGTTVFTTIEEKDGATFLAKHQLGFAGDIQLRLATFEAKERAVWGANAKPVAEAKAYTDFRDSVLAAVKKFPPKKADK